VEPPTALRELGGATDGLARCQALWQVA